MRNYRLLILLISLTCLFKLQAQVSNQLSYLKKEGTAVQLVVDSNPFLVLGGELGNSSASSIADIERIFPKLQRMGLNTVLVPAYWDLIEPVEGQFDCHLIDKIIRQARENNWKNSMSCYEII